MTACAIILEGEKDHLLFPQQPLQPPEQFPEEQAQLSGQPIHFLPLFLDL